MTHALPPPGRYAESIAAIPMPPEIARLPIHPKLRMPLPWFCQQDPPDFRVIRPEALAQAHKKRLCWVTGEPRFEKRMAFVTGPMCVITTTSAELPCRLEAARYAARACPFLANPRMVRNDKDLPDGVVDPAGHMIRRNPGVAAVVVTDRYTPFADPRGGVLFQMGPPLFVEWYAHRRLATRAEVEASIETGLVGLREIAAQHDGEEGLRELEARVEAVRRWLPLENAA